MIQNPVVAAKEQIDLTQDTVTPGTMRQGVTAHNAAGEKITGTAHPIRGNISQLPQSGGTITMLAGYLVGKDLIVAITGNYTALIAYRKSDNVFCCETYNSSGITSEDVTIETSGGLVWPVSPDLSLSDGRTWTTVIVEIWS